MLDNKDIDVKYDENGFFRTEVLAGSYYGGIRNFKCFLKAGNGMQPGTVSG